MVGKILVSLSLFLIILSLQFAAEPAFADNGPQSLHDYHFSTLAPDTDVQLQWPLNNSYSVSIDLKVIASPENDTSIFWGHQLVFMNGEWGYIGYGIGGTVKVATVAVLDAISGSTSDPSGGCNIGVPFLKTGTGFQCFILYDWRLGSNYRLQFSRLSDSNGYENWEGSIYDYSTSNTTIIGNLLTSPAYGQLMATSSTWDEYSAAGSCSTPTTSVIFSNPHSSNIAGDHAPIKAQVTYGNTTCQDSNVRYLGSGAYESDAGKDVTRTTSPQAWLWTQEPNPVSQTLTSISESSSPTTASKTTTTSVSATSTTTGNTVKASSSISTSAPQVIQPTTASSTMIPQAIPALPGFPLEAVIIGIVLGLVLLVTRRRRK